MRWFFRDRQIFRIHIQEIFWKRRKKFRKFNEDKFKKLDRPLRQGNFYNYNYEVLYGNQRNKKADKNESNTPLFFLCCGFFVFRFLSPCCLGNLCAEISCVKQYNHIYRKKLVGR